jgi:hypothetical protein
MLDHVDYHSVWYRHLWRAQDEDTGTPWKSDPDEVKDSDSSFFRVTSWRYEFDAAGGSLY